MRRNPPILIALLVFVFCFSATLALGQSTQSTTHHQFQLKTPPGISHGSISRQALKSLATSPSNPLPVWDYQVISPRDGNLYDGVIVGRNPNTRGDGAAVSVTTQVVPVILKFHRIGTAVDFKTVALTTTSGDVNSDPTVADTGCFTGAANVPLKILAQSPLLKNADFNFGGTDVGTTQYVDAFQRGEFWRGIDKENYHVRLNPKILAPLVVDVPAASGLSLVADVFGPSFTLCSPEGIVDINFLDAVVVSALTQVKGINPGTFPMFMIYNTGMSFGDPTNINNCCAGGYHSINPAGPLTFQTYSPFDFDTSGVFGTSSLDTAIASHEVGEWMNDPYLINPTPSWGHVGQVGGCQNNYEVG